MNILPINISQKEGWAEQPLKHVQLDLHFRLWERATLNVEKEAESWANPFP